VGLKLTRFKVNKFRSIEKSDWIDVADNSCLVGTNEAGKTNLLLALWKLNPANNEPIVPLDDFPRDLFSNYDAGGHETDVFVEADFELDEPMAREIAALLGCELEQVRTVLVKRRYSGKYNITFPYSTVDSVPVSRLSDIIRTFAAQVKTRDLYTKESGELQALIDAFLKEQLDSLPVEVFRANTIEGLLASITAFITANFGKKKNLPGFFESKLISKIKQFETAFDSEPVETTKDVRNKILKVLPRFVYYSDYGNLDSEIYLPRVMEDMERDDLSESARAKLRTLQVLFKFVNLSPQEIHELGDDAKVVIEKQDQHGRILSSEEQEQDAEAIQAWSDKKRKRGVLLRSAATQLTKQFKEWWLQGDYIFAFDADGRHFRINVSDTLRPEPIELEGRSRGLQWFFSFFLVFLVETKEAHANSILLLDEPGLSLHPLAQYDLAKFFKKLSQQNQLLYTSHSPFLVDMDNLANIRVVYADADSGRTQVSADLRENAALAEKSIFPVHAALGLTVCDTLLLGCVPILVEGPSDQIYLSLIKRHLTGIGLLRSNKEIVFIPTGGVRGMGPVAKLVSARDDALPVVFLDSDVPGRDYQKRLTSGRYKDEPRKVLGVADFLGEGDFEIEDLFPPKALVDLIDRYYRADTYFEDSHDKDKPFVDQVERWADEQSVVLKEGWKVDLARSVQGRLDKVMADASDELVQKWKQIFDALLAMQ